MTPSPKAPKDRRFGGFGLSRLPYHILWKKAKLLYWLREISKRLDVPGIWDYNSEAIRWALGTPG